MKIDWIDEQVGLSGAIDDYNQLEGTVDFVVNARMECHDDLIELSKRGISYFWIPVVDYFPPTADQMKSLIKIIKCNPGKKILVHCTLGMGRSATLVLMYMIWKYEYTVEEALSKLQAIRPKVLPTQMQVDKLYKYYNRIRKGE